MIRLFLLSLGLLLLVLPGAASVSFTTTEPIDIALGDSVTLTGTAEHTTVLYLFMTGPDLYPTGVSLMDGSARADSGDTIRVPVNPDGSWEYAWHTQGISGKTGLKAGTYTLYASDTPGNVHTLARCTTCRYATIIADIIIPQPKEPASETGSIDIRVPAGTNPTIYLDGAPRGTAPALITGVPTGSRVLELRSAASYSWSAIVQVTEGTTVLTADPLPLPHSGSITITSSPPGIPILRNGAPTGKNTPAILTDVSTGKQIINLRKDGYHPWTRTITVYPGKTEVLVASLVSSEPADTPEPSPPPAPVETGALRVTSVPAGAEVTLNNQLYGKTPFHATDLAPATYQVRISSPGYAPWSGTVTIAAGETLDISETLSPLPGPAPTSLSVFPALIALLVLFRAGRW